MIDRTPGEVEIAPPEKVELAVNRLYLQEKGLPRGRPWRRGQSGNPSGRPRGSRNPSTQFAEALRRDGPEAFMPWAVDRALRGDTGLLKFCFASIFSPRRRELARFELPIVKTAADAARAHAALAEAVGAGELPPEEANRFARKIRGFPRPLGARHWKRRLAALEAADLRHRAPVPPFDAD